MQITKSNLVEVIRFDDADQWFKVKIALTSLDEKAGKEKESYQHILLSATDVRDAYDKVRKHMSKVGVGFVIPSVIFQKITEVFPLEEEGGSHALHGAPDLAAEPEAV